MYIMYILPDISRVLHKLLSHSSLEKTDKFQNCTLLCFVYNMLLSVLMRYEDDPTKTFKL